MAFFYAQYSPGKSFFITKNDTYNNKCHFLLNFGNIYFIFLYFLNKYIATIIILTITPNNIVTPLPVFGNIFDDVPDNEFVFLEVFVILLLFPLWLPLWLPL